MIETSATRPALPGSGVSSLPQLQDPEFDYIRNFVRDRSAIVLDDGKQYLVQTRLAAMLRDEGLTTFGALVDELRRRPTGTIAGEVIDAMTTNETSFFRDTHPFDAVAGTIIPAIGADRPGAGLTIWCAACSSGQEPYSLAIVLAERYPSLVRSGRVRIVATDLSPAMVARCCAGRYTALEVNRGLPARYLVKYFDQDGRDWIVKPDIRSMVQTRELNLTGAWTGVPRSDIVWLRNVLIYFGPDTKAAILKKIRREVLKPGGHLFLGASETTLNVDDTFVRREVGRSICYQSPEHQEGVL